MRAEHFLHPIANAKRQVTCGVKLAVAPTQNSLREFMTKMSFHRRKPIEKKSGQRQPAAFCCLSGTVTQSAFRQRNNDVWFEVFHCRFQSSTGCQRPDEIFVIGNPCGQSRTKSALPQPMNRTRQPEWCVHKKIISKVRIAGDVQFKRRTLHEHSMHDNAYPAVISGRHNAYQQNTRFGCHAAPLL